MFALLITSSWLVFQPHPGVLGWRLIPAIALTFGFALAAWGVRAVSAGGAAAGMLVTIVIYLASGLAGFSLVVALFLLTFVATRIGSARKQHLGIAEHTGGRAAAQVFANLGAAAMCALPLIFYPNVRGLLIGMVAAIAEAAADTVSSEVGEAVSSRAFLITDFRVVEAGTNGGVSLAGTFAGVIAAMIVAWLGASLNLYYARSTLIVVAAAIVGTLIDSVLGATLERPNRLANNSVNFLSSSAAAMLALAGWFVQQR